VTELANMDADEIELWYEELVKYRRAVHDAQKDAEGA
jgi:hypothetical protein